ncbi:hypothetical protein E1B28_005648 [Marasmius oreades]|uniref:Protein kinase domain-containing protein n=1 Tax=Marasmius oreades TaxID=181124 RepID=A0A9P7S3L1_9AGAR|nr:uncharacterized protein E1B28_005648 [Marasmius oreades]KAG7094839.1 hypothetical protein E1B28_005648 [Marasmius oreades]
MIPTTTGVIKGSIRWMAPEVYAFSTGTVEKNAKEDRTPRDIYAFACTVLEILTGKPPFSGLIDPAVFYQVSVRRMRPERPSEGWCPNHIWNLVELCWDEDPLKRPRTHTYLQQIMLSGNPDPGGPGFKSEGPGTPIPLDTSPHQFDKSPLIDYTDILGDTSEDEFNIFPIDDSPYLNALSTDIKKLVREWEIVAPAQPRTWIEEMVDASGVHECLRNENQNSGGVGRARNHKRNSRARRIG